jgi:hypothetical protein
MTDGIDGTDGLDGKRGQRGQRGTPDNRLLVIFVIFMLVMAYVVHRQDNNTARLDAFIHQQARTSYAQCIDRKINVDTANAYYSRNITIEMHNPFIDDTVRSQRIANLGSVYYAQPSCGPKPR